ncbi:MAG: TorF family putative porin [Sinobacteraceae bacterium]|nr:TorF family putative porin [Nevskiaceae bacterium]
MSDRHSACDARFQRPWAWLLVGALCAPTAWGDGFGGALGVASDDVFRGISLSDHQPSVQGDVHYRADAGWFAGLAAASVKRGRDQGTTVELDPYLGFAWALDSDWSARLAYVHYAYPFNSPHRLYDYDEADGTLAWRDRAFLTVAASPDTGAETTRGTASGRAALAYSLGWHQPLPGAFSVSAGVGYYDLRWVIGTGYVYWNAGLSYDWGPMHLDASYIGTNATARQLYYDELAENRWVVSLLWRF